MPVAELTPDEDQARLVLRQLMSYRGLSGAEIARAVGVSRQMIHEKLAGKSRVSLQDIVDLCHVLNVEPQVFFMDPDAALRWVLDNGGSASRSCESPTLVGPVVVRRRGPRPDRRRPSWGRSRWERRPALVETL